MKSAVIFQICSVDDVVIISRDYSIGRASLSPQSSSLPRSEAIESRSHYLTC